MDYKLESTLDRICGGCLSTGRTISQDIGEDCVSYLNNIFGCQGNTDINAVRLCWECRNILKKIVKFNCRLRLARDLLNSYMVTQNKKSLVSLSSLQVTDCEEIVINPEQSADIKEEIETESQDTMVTQTMETVGSLSSLQLTSHCEEIVINPEKSADIKDEFQTDLDVKVKSHTTDLIKIEFDGFRDGYGSDDNAVVDVKVDNVVEGNNELSRLTEDSDDEPLATILQKKVPNNHKNCVKLKILPEEKAKLTTKSKRIRSHDFKVEGFMETLYLTQEEIEQERQTIRESEKYKQLVYRCDNCVVGFNHKLTFEHHMRKHEATPSSYMCEVCRTHFTNKPSLVKHVRRHKRRWRCKICKLTSSRMQTVADHCAVHSADAGATYTCGQCGHTERTQYRFRVHLQSHKERVSCPSCQRTFSSSSALSTHTMIAT